MRWLFIFLLSVPCVVAAQEYRLDYDKNDLPELYNTIHISIYKKGLNGTTLYNSGELHYLQAGEEIKVKRGELTFDREELYHQEGQLKFLLKIDDQDIPLTLQLPVLTDIRFNLYTDSIKPVMDYYLNIEGIYNNGKIYPMDATTTSVTASQGSMQGLTWVKPEEVYFDKVTFTAVAKHNPAIAKDITIYIKQVADARDYEE